MRIGGAEFRLGGLRPLLLSFAALLVAGVACTTNHDSLARKPNENKGGGGAGGVGGTAGSGFGNSGNQAQGGRYIGALAARQKGLPFDRAEPCARSPAFELGLSDPEHVVGGLYR